MRPGTGAPGPGGGRDGRREPVRGTRPACPRTAVPRSGALGRAAGQRAGRRPAGAAVHGYHRLPSHRWDQQRPPGGPGRSRGSRLHRRLGGLRRQRRRHEQLRPRREEPADLHDHEPRPVRRDRLPERLVVVGGRSAPRAAARRVPAERGHRLRPERRRHRGGPQLDRHGRRHVRLGLVGRRPELGRRQHDAGPLRQQHQRDGDDPGSEPPRDTGPAGHLDGLRRALQLGPQRPRHAPCARELRRADVQPRRERDGAGPPDHVVQALRRRQRRRRHRHAEVVLRRPDLDHRYRSQRRALHRERRRQQPREDARRRHPLGGRRGPQVRLLGHGVVELHAHRPRAGLERADRPRRREGRQGLLERDRHGRLRVRGLHQDARPVRDRRQQDHGRHDPDARRPRQQRGRRARHEPRARLRPRRSGQARRVRLLLAAARRR